MLALAAAALDAAPLRVLIAGMEHGHVTGFLQGADPQVVTIAGVWEEDDAVWSKYGRDPKLLAVTRYRDLGEAVASSHPDAVWAFSDTRGHLAVARAAAPRHVSMIVEKPLAVSWAAAREMAALARANGTLILTNYETSWYPTVWEARRQIAAGTLGPLRQLNIQMGHEGPVRIGVQPEFLAWLRDPPRGGGGALFDFGCYGVNLATWWLGNRPPEWVSAHTSTFDRMNYPNCDDHAVIELVYPDTQVTITASWHWPYNRKDAALFGEKGSLITTDDTHYAGRSGREPGHEHVLAKNTRRPLQWFAETLRAGRDPVDDPSSLANNLLVVQVMEAARRSAAEHRSVALSEIR